MRRGLARRLRRSRLGRFFEGTGLYSAAGVLLGVIGVVLLLIIAFSTVGLLWVGDRVTGVEQGGIVYYRVHGVGYSMSEAGSFRNRDRVAVYFDGSDPSRAILDTTTARVSAAAFGAGPLVAGAAFATAGLVKKRRNRHRRDEAILHGERFGQGLDPEMVQRLLRERRVQDRQMPQGRPFD